MGGGKIVARNGLSNIKALIEVSKRKQLPEQAFVSDLKRSIELSDSKGRRKPSKLYKPSNMNCIRAMYYTRVGKKPDDDGSSYTMWGICNSGTDTHERVQKAVADMINNGFDCEYVDVAEFVKQRKLDNLKIVRKEGMETHLHHKTLNLSFLCDGIIRYNNHYYILEIKTESANKWYIREGVDPSHYNQATAYSVSFNINEVLFLYINRDIFDFKPFIFNVTDEMKQDFVGYIDECEQYVSKLIAPPKPEDVTRKTCEYCNYKSYCRKEGVKSV